MHALRFYTSRPVAKALRLFPIAAVAALMAGCASVPPSTTVAPLAATDLASTQTLASQSGTWPASNWWQGFNDPQLNGLMDEALAHSPSLLAAQARLDKAQAFEDQVHATLKPTLTLNGSVVETKQSLNMGFPPAFKDFLPGGYLPEGRFTVDANYDIDLWGKSRAAIKGAASQSRAAELDTVVVRQNIATAVVNAYVELNRLYETRDELALLKQGSDIKLDLYQARADHKLDARDVLLSAQDDQAQIAQRIAATDGAIRLQASAIAALVGAGPDRGLTIARPQLAPVDVNTLPDNVPLDLIGRRADIAAARLRVEAQGQNIKYTRADFYPNLKLNAYWGVQALGLQYLGSPDSQIGSIGPAISLPIFNGGRLRANYRGAEADYNDAVATYDDTLTTALQQVADAASATQTTAGELTAAQARRDSAETTYELTKARFGKGLNTKMDVLTAHAKVVAIDSALTDLRAQAYRDRVSFIAALGGGFQPQ